jgi:hypothetical protein
LWSFDLGGAATVAVFAAMQHEIRIAPPPAKASTFCAVQQKMLHRSI